MNTRKAVIRVGSICLKVAVFVLICFGLVSLGQTTYRYTHAVFSEEAFEEAPGKDIRINIPETKIELLVSDEVLAERKANWTPREPKVTTGYLARYASMVTSGNRGAILEIPR